jgi:hypothetical protein
MLKFYFYTLFLFFFNLLNGQIQIKRINDSSYFEIKKISAKKYQITKNQKNIKIYQTIIKDTSKIIILDYYRYNEYYYENSPYITNYIIFYYKNGKISKEINFKRKRIHFYSQIEVKKYDTSGQLKHYSFNSNKRIGKNYSFYSDYIKGNLIYEEKSSYYNFKYKKTYLKKAYMIDSLKNKYKLVKNCWSDYSTYQMNNSNIYFIGDLSWKVKLTKTDVKNEYILTHYINNDKKQLSQKFIQINKKKQTFRNDDQLWSYLKNSTDTFFNDSGKVDYIQRFSKKGNLIFYQTYNSKNEDYIDFQFISKNITSVKVLSGENLTIIIKNKNSYLIKKYYKDTIYEELLCNKKFTYSSYYKNGKLDYNVKTKTYHRDYKNLMYYFKDKKGVGIVQLINDL